MAVRFIVEPADESAVREVRAVADRLQRERQGLPYALGQGVRRVRASLWWAIRRRTSLRRLRRHASAVEQKARSQLLTLEIHLLVKSPCPIWAEIHLTQLLEAFEQYASVPNRLRARRPRRGRRFDRCFAAHRSWPGAKFLVSYEEAYALTGLPLLALATLKERQVWTRWSGERGEAPRVTGPRSGEGPDG